ncbi:pancreatic triacylglycerol lipase-like [Anticarsia gemmatalis]|uniref:pancreatic triacylglycerol lipase-like n=1 Tax=Anticarsia gemmatalis TaxID=129554 RepID=UPI003F75C9B0
MHLKDNSLLLYLFLYWMDCISGLSYNHKYKNIYGPNYGETWIYFPDGDSIPHFVNLTRSEQEDMLDVRGSTADEIEFRLYVGNDTDTYIILDEWGEPLEHNHDISVEDVLSTKPVKIITHGWKSSVDKEGVSDVKNAYLESQDVSVITIDWSGIADSIFYHWVANETKAIGAKVATFIGELHTRYNVSEKRFHLIGHSLGAHVMGIAAAKSNFTVDRITGLDPARPLFEYPLQEDDLAKLDPSDADFVDVIHTCGGVLGFETDTGTVDFYPNNGIPPQPGCESIQKIFEACSHGRSFHYFSESIKYPTAFPAYQCLSWTDYLENKCNNFGFMGDRVDRNLTGKYYLKTNAFRPFGFYTWFYF